MYTTVYVCAVRVCVCVCERERDGGGRGIRREYMISLPL